MTAALLLATVLVGCSTGFVFGWMYRAWFDLSGQAEPSDELVEQHTVIVLDPPTWHRYEAMILAGHPVLVERGPNAEGV